jgi:hypothetical protein
MAPNQISYRAGQMQKFLAQRTFMLGQTGIQISQGMEVLFDGTRVSVDGNEVTLPQLRGAIRQGWLVLEAEYDEENTEASRPVAANIQVRHATKGGNPFMNQAPTRSAMTMTESDEREVGQVASHAQAARQANQQYRRGQPVDTPQGSSVEMQDGVPVRRLKTAAGERSKQQRTVLTSESAGDAIRRANSVQVDPGQGITREEMLERMSPEQREGYLATTGALKAAHFDDGATQAKIVGRVTASKAPKTQDGISAKVTTGGGIETADPSTGTTEKPVETVRVEDGITFRGTNLSKPKPPVVKDTGDTDVRRRVAKAICPDFPDNYDFTLPERKKLARLQADYEDREDVLRAVFAAESDAFKLLLVAEFPAVFA